MRVDTWPVTEAAIRAHEERLCPLCPETLGIRHRRPFRVNRANSCRQDKPSNTIAIQRSVKPALEFRRDIITLALLTSARVNVAIRVDVEDR